MKKKEILNALVAVLLAPLGVLAQTTNEGVLYVSPGTQFSTVSDFDNKPGAAYTNDGEAFIYADFNNDGQVGFTTGEQGFTRFEGNAVQQLSGASTSYFYDVLFNNTSSTTASFEHSGSISVANEVEFLEGIVDNDNFGGEVIFEQDAYHLSTSDVSHVDGPVRKIGDTGFTYPVGDNQYYRYCAISAPTNQADGFKAKYFFSNPGTTYPLTSKQSVIQLIDNQEYWEVTRETGSSTVLLTLSWDEFTTTPTSVVAAPYEEIHIVRWDAGQSKWVDEGGVVNTSMKEVTTPMELESYGVFTLARVIKEPFVTVYEGLTPNGDGNNDHLIVEGIDAYPNTALTVFNRWGTKVYETDDYQNDWDGTSDSRFNVGGDELPEGTYYYLLKLGGDPENSNYEKIFKGYFYIKRN